MGQLLKSPVLQRIFTLTSGLWIGAFITIGFLVTPIVFSTLGDRQVAGVVASHIFKAIASVSVGLSVVLMILANVLVGRGLPQFRLIRWALLLMFAASFAQAFVIIPWMISLRDEAAGAGLSIMESSLVNAFTHLHQASSAVFFIQIALGIAVVWRSTKLPSQ